jgi:hypothetical protein
MSPSRLIAASRGTHSSISVKRTSRALANTRWEASTVTCSPAAQETTRLSLGIAAGTRRPTREIPSRA